VRLYKGTSDLDRRAAGYNETRPKKEPRGGLPRDIPLSHA